MRAGRKEVLKMPSRIGNRIGAGNPSAIESERTGFVGEGGFQVVRGEFARRVQKSRSTYVRDAGTPASHSLSSGRNEGRDFTRAYHAFAASSSIHGTSPR